MSIGYRKPAGKISEGARRQPWLRVDAKVDAAAHAQVLQVRKCSKCLNGDDCDPSDRAPLGCGQSQSERCNRPMGGRQGGGHEPYRASIMLCATEDDPHHRRPLFVGPRSAATSTTDAQLLGEATVQVCTTGLQVPLAESVTVGKSGASSATVRPNSQVLRSALWLWS
jgi:hypothetical protein